jgi:hypothetical protein
MQTIGMWQSANIEYTSQQEYDDLKDQWSIPFKADLIRIFPFLNTNEIKEERNQFCLKLNNLPPGTTGYDLKEIIQITHAQTCYIPRNKNYLRKRFAILSFKTQEQKYMAQDRHVTLGNTVLDWHEMSTKLCAICASANHLAKDCNIKAFQHQKIITKKENKQKFGHLYRRFKPVGFPTQSKPTRTTQFSQSRSFADVVKQKKLTTEKPSNPDTQHKTSDQPSLNNIMQVIQQLGDEIKQIKTLLNKMDERIGILEDDRYFFYTDQEENTNMEEEDDEEPSNTTTLRKQITPPPQIFQETNNPFNYQRKRPALSPAQDLHERQNTLHQ